MNFPGLGSRSANTAAPRRPKPLPHGSLSSPAEGNGTEPAGSGFVPPPPGQRDRFFANAARRWHDAAIKKPPAPQPEGHESPQLEIDISPPLLHPQQLHDVLGVEDPAGPAPLGQQQILDDAAQLSPEPPPQGNGEAMLGPIDDLVRQDPPHGLLEDVLRRASAKPEPRRNRRSELDELVVE